LITTSFRSYSLQKQDLIKKTARPNTKAAPARTIVASEVQLIDETGKNAGVVPLQEAQRQAKAKGLQLIQVGKNVDPPVVRLVADFEQYQKEVEEKVATKLKAKEQAKQGQGLKMKELRFGHRIEEHDVRVKIAALSKFLEKKYQVKVAIEFKNWRDFDAFLATQLLNNILERVAHLCRPSQAKAAGRFVYCVFEPDPKGSVGQTVQPPAIEASVKRMSDADKQRAAQSKLPQLNEQGEEITDAELEAMREAKEEGGEEGEEEAAAAPVAAPGPTFDKQRKKPFKPAAGGSKVAPAQKRRNFQKAF
jgi:translation initiation factor IF-3